MTPTLIWALFVAVLGLGLLWPGWAAADRRAWATLLLATLVGCLGLWLLPGRAAGLQMPWLAAGLTWAGTLGIGWMLHQRLQMPFSEMGLTWRQHPGSLGPALAVSAGALLLHALSLDWAASAPQVLPLSAWAYQASLPGLVEETLFRGVALALADRAWPPRRNWAGVPLGWGALALSLVFVALHGPASAALLGVLPAAALCLWLRLRTGSLLLPVLVHNLWNLLVLAAAR